MWPTLCCFVSQPNYVVLEIEVDLKAKGQECLEKVCKTLGICNEEDYFGLKYHSSKGKELWVNLRNPLETQLPGPQPYRLTLRVKFWVPPHLLLQETTKHQFYLHARLELQQGWLQPEDPAGAVRLAALVAQAELGDYEPSALHQSHYTTYLPPQNPPIADFVSLVTQEHSKLKGMRQAIAEYWFLKEVSELQTFGEEHFLTHTSSGLVLHFGIGPHGISVRDEDAVQKHSIPYTAVVQADALRRTFQLTHVDGGGEKQMLVVKLDNSSLAAGLYRTITEKHAFYSCETVRSAVTSQYIRDFKGTIVSIFNEDSSLGKKYVFDIRRTCREVYDNARRALYQMGEMSPRPVGHQENYLADLSSCPNCRSQQCRDNPDAYTCRICMDRELNTAFLPCGHAIVCQDCATRCERCPLCRADIKESREIFLPFSTRQGCQEKCVSTE